MHCTDGETQLTGPVVSGTANESGPLTIEDGVVTGCDESATEIAIPEGVTKIGAGAFEGCDSLASITIPKGVTRIGASAFCGCTSLEEITIPNSVTKIGEAAFRDCQSLAEITILNGVMKIDDFAFCGCESLEEITIPDSVRKIGKYAFEDCQSLADIRFGGTKAQWKAVNKGDGWDSGIPASTVLCTDGETQLVDFGACGPLTIKGGVVTGCDKSATEIAIPEGVTKIGECAFEGCQSLASITIPGSVMEIGDWAFSCCWSLTDIRFGGTESQWKAVEKVNGPGHASKVHCTDKDVWWM